MPAGAYGKMRVLVVEDHATLANRIAQGLRQAGAVYDGAAALEAAAQTAYDVIVLDRDLPAIHGDRVCRAVASSGPRVVMLTAAAYVDDRIDGLQPLPPAPSSARPRIGPCQAHRRGRGSSRPRWAHSCWLMRLPRCSSPPRARPRWPACPR